MAKLIYTTNRVRIETPFVEAFVNALKATIPSGSRQWNQSERVWIVYHPYVSEARRLTVTYFSPVEEEGVEHFETNEQFRRREEREREEERARRQREYSREGFGYSHGWQHNRDYYDQENNRQQSQRNNQQGNPFTRTNPSDFDVLFITQDAPKEVANAAYKALARLKHPDSGGTTAEMQAINAAFERVKRLKGW